MGFVEDDLVALQKYPLGNGKSSSWANWGTFHASSISPNVNVTSEEKELD
jgi:hypothetical protein